MEPENSTQSRQEKESGKRRFFLNHKRSSAMVFTLALHGVFILAALLFVVVDAFKQPPEVIFKLDAKNRPQPDLRLIKVPVKENQRSESPKLVNVVVSNPKVEVSLKMPQMTANPGRGNFGDGNSLGDFVRGTPFGINIDINYYSPSNELIGRFYDLKQDAKGKLTEIGQRAARDPFARESQLMATEVVKKFIQAGCNPRKLEDYFSAPRAKVARTLAIPPMSADAAPEAFGVADQVKGSYWICHYTGQIAAPESGRYRFCGIGDDILVVKVGRKIVLDASWPELIGEVTSWESDAKNNRKYSLNGNRYGRFNGSLWNQIYSQIEDNGGLEGDTLFGSAFRSIRIPGMDANADYMKAACRMAVGDWISLRKGEAVDIDIIIGEIPGGEFTCRLMIEQEGQDYRMVASDAGLRPVLPVFKTNMINDQETIKQMELDPNEMTITGPIFGAEINAELR